MNVKGKTILITGGGRGLGRAMALAFAAKGARLAIVGVNQGVVEEAAALCREAGAEARAYVADVSDESAVVDLFDRVANDFQALDGVINNAGITRDGLLVKAKDGKVVKLEISGVVDVSSGTRGGVAHVFFVMDLVLSSVSRRRLRKHLARDSPLPSAVVPVVPVPR